MRPASSHAADKAAGMLKIILTALFFLLLCVSAGFCLYGYARGCFHSVDSFRSYIAGCGPLAPAALTLTQAIQVVVPVIPGFLGCAVAAGLWGAAGGFACNYIGICGGSLIAYWLARRFGMPLVQRMVPMQKYRRLTRWVTSRKSYTVVFFLAILLPLAPDDFLCWLSGLLGMPPRRFTWIILLGKPWIILAYSLVFSQLL